jgi:transcriptional regulator with XRE-family HTH domain
VNASELLREARIGAGLSQREVGTRAELPQPEVSRIERGHVSPRVDTLDRLLRACGRELLAETRLGSAVDRTLLVERLRRSPGERVRLAAEEWRRTRAFRRSEPPAPR